MSLPHPRNQGRWLIPLLTASFLIGVAGPAQAASDRLQRLLDRTRQQDRLSEPVQSAREPERQQGSAAATREVYRVNAQYRGAIKKGFDNLGDVTVVYHPEGNGGFGIDMGANLRHPQKKRRYQFKVALHYRLDGSRVTPVDEQNEFSDEAKKHREKILQNAPFIYLIRYAPLPPGGRGEQSYTVGGKPFLVRYVPTGRHVEATVYDSGRWLGKFFLLRRRAESGPNDFDKFRINTKGDTVLSLVCDRRGLLD